MAKKKLIDELTDTAYHEAAHAVTACRYRISFSRVTVIPREGSHGHIAFRVVPKRLRENIGGSVHSKDYHERRILVDLAGWAASDHLHGRISDWRKVGAGGDIEFALQTVDRLVGSNEEAEAYINLLVIRARAVVRDPIIWESIKAVASTLLDRKTVKELEVSGIIRKTQEAWIKNRRSGR